MCNNYINEMLNVRETTKAYRCRQKEWETR